MVLIRLLAIIWASPYTLLGLFLGFIGLCTGGHARIRGRIIEFYGGGVKWLLHRFPNGQFTLALTLGHTILGQTDAALDISREHEMVHVRQFERWGPLMTLQPIAFHWRKVAHQVNVKPNNAAWICSSSGLTPR